ncbi:MAG: helix-turn-helix transcriptional regulator [Prevotella sp.]|nr:helix-turn-helix transcriptional regulator [Prevotella sp.]
MYYTLDGQQEKRLTKFSREVTQPLTELIRERYPQCFERLIKIHKVIFKRSNNMNDEDKFKIVDRFVRCNFGENDLLTQDIENGIMHFEEVKCPMRGICPDENVICKPKGLLKLTRAQKEVANLYVEGYSFTEIAEILGKNPSTVKSLLYKLKMKLNVKKSRNIIKVLKLENAI